jgi:hypothetical protein
MMQWQYQVDISQFSLEGAENNLVEAVASRV